MPGSLTGGLLPWGPWVKRSGSVLPASSTRGVDLVSSRTVYALPTAWLQMLKNAVCWVVGEKLMVSLSPASSQSSLTMVIFTVDRWVIPSEQLTEVPAVVQSWLAGCVTVRDCVEVPVAPWLSVTVSTTVYVPAAA